MQSSSIGSATDTDVSGIAEFRVRADQSAPIPHIHTATFRRTNPHPPSRCIAGSDIPVRNKGAAAMEPQLTIGEIDVRICTRFGGVIQDLTSHEIWSRTRLLPGISPSLNNYTGLKFSVPAL